MSLVPCFVNTLDAHFRERENDSSQLCYCRDPHREIPWERDSCFSATRAKLLGKLPVGGRFADRQVCATRDALVAPFTLPRTCLGVFI